MGISTTISEADILDELIGPDDPTFPAEAAKAILELKFSDRAKERMRELLDGNNRGELTQEQVAELDAYRRVGLVIDLMQAKARVSIAHSN